nr:MAG TPA: hypothetical protein [Caudoviricetes sp.]
MLAEEQKEQSNLSASLLLKKTIIENLANSEDSIV